MRRTILSGLAISLASLGAGCASVSTERADYTGLDGQRVTIEVVAPGPSGTQRAQEAVQPNIQLGLELFGEDGQLAQLNRGANDGFHQIESFDLYRAVLLAIDWAKASGGAYDPTIGPVVALYNRPGLRPPTDNEVTVALDRVGWRFVTVASEAQSVRFRTPNMALDLSGVAEGYLLDMAVRGFSQGSRAGLARTDRYAYAWERPPGQPGWWVDLPDPRTEGRSLGQVQVRSRGVAIEGQRVDSRPELFDGRTGRPALTDLDAVVAVADSAADAAGVARSLYALGSTNGGGLLGRARRVEALFVVTGNGPPYVLASASLRDRVQLSEELIAETGGDVRFLLPPTELTAN